VSAQASVKSVLLLLAVQAQKLDRGLIRAGHGLAIDIAEPRGSRQRR
jgi:hypothetical protein